MPDLLIALAPLVFGFVGANAPIIKLQNHRMVNQPIHCRHRRHRILENLVPLGEDQITADHEAPALIPFSKEGEENLHLLSGLLNVAQIIKDNNGVTVEFLEHCLQLQSRFGLQELLHHLPSRLFAYH